MNLQATHRSPYASAMALDDKRLRKMILESAQMYCTITQTPTYKPTHQHHPVTKWASNNISWLIHFHWAASAEYMWRFGKMHKSFFDVGQHIKPTRLRIPISFQNSARNKDFDFTHVKDPQQAYRQYMNARWHSDQEKHTREIYSKTDPRTATRHKLPLWTRRNPPRWAGKCHHRTIAGWVVVWPDEAYLISHNKPIPTAKAPL